MIQQKCLLRNGSVVASRRQGGGNGLAVSLKTETVSGGAVARGAAQQIQCILAFARDWERHVSWDGHDWTEPRTRGLPALARG